MFRGRSLNLLHVMTAAMSLSLLATPSYAEMVNGHWVEPTPPESRELQAAGKRDAARQKKEDEARAARNRAEAEQRTKDQATADAAVAADRQREETERKTKEL